MTQLTEAQEAARAIWAAGDYDTIASHIWEVGAGIVRRLEVAPEEELLDVACGTGNATIPAALAGARVTGVDLTPELFAAGRDHAADAGVEIDWVEGDAEALPFDDASFDVAVSTFGVMFAPAQETAAAELVRVLRPGGRLGLCSWTPEGNVGAFFRLMAEHVPPPPGAAPPTLWGAEDHVTKLLADAGLELTLERDVVDLSFDSVTDAVELYATRFGPVVRAREQLEPIGRWGPLRDGLEALFRDHNGASDGRLSFAGEYLTVIGVRSEGG